MPNRTRFFLLCFVLLGAATGYLVLWYLRPEPEVMMTPPVPTPPLKEAAPAQFESTPESRRAERMALTEAKLMRKLRQALERKDARPNELILGFKDADAYRRFLDRARRAGVSVLKGLDRLNLARVQIDDLAAFESDLNEHGNDYADLDANLLVFPPTVPERDERVAGTQTPFKDGLLEFLGASGDISQWGQGVTIAVLDSGVGADATFGQGKVRYLDVGMGLSPASDDGHGTGVAALISGHSPDAQGVAQGADILSIRVTGTDGLSDGFTLMQAIVAAADNGARIINISLGAYGSSPGLASAIEYARSRGSVIVASAGNDQATQLTWPAAHPDVISVGAVDANGKQVIFSNSGDGLSMTAPGFGVPTAWTGNQRVLADGTSFSAPLVSASIAALMTIYPGITAARAWEILQQTANDGGPAGADPDYGAGTPNLTWARHLNDPNWFDTAISSNYVNPQTGNFDVVVQNRSGIGVNGLKLNVAINGDNREFQLPWMPPGGRFVASVPIDMNELRNSGSLQLKSNLDNPSGQTDAMPKNNWMGMVLSIPGKN
jgi:Subtilase family